jgi:GxxExxY protein
MDQSFSAENVISGIIVDACYKVHSFLGPGLLESIYETCLHHELTSRGLFVERQKQLTIVYDGIILENAYRLDLCVDDTVIVELKAVENLNYDLCLAQMLTYLKLSQLRIGLIVNFNSSLIKNGIKRVVNSRLAA